MSEDKKDIINEFIAPEDRKNWHKKPQPDSMKKTSNTSQGKKRCNINSLQNGHSLAI